MFENKLKHNVRDQNGIFFSKCVLLDVTVFVFVCVYVKYVIINALKLNYINYLQNKHTANLNTLNVTM